MRKTAFPLVFTLLFGTGCLFSCNNPNPPAQDQATGPGSNAGPQTEAALTGEELLAQGEHLVVTSGCDDCHSPKTYQNGIPMPDESRRLSGHPADLKLKPFDANTVKNGWAMTNEHFTAWVGPWGTSFSSNITSDSATGIGALTEAQFFTVLREGKYHGAKDGRMLLPPMPWPNFAKFTDAEIRAIYAFLQATKPIKNQVPAPIPPKGP